MKTKKALAKRFKCTNNGKLMCRVKGQNHYNAKDTGEEGIHKRRMEEFDLDNKARSRYLPYCY